MTNREYMIGLLQAHNTEETYQYFMSEFGCGPISVDECLKHDKCYECWEHWLESEVNV